MYECIMYEFLCFEINKLYICNNYIISKNLISLFFYCISYLIKLCFFSFRYQREQTTLTATASAKEK